MMTILAMLLVLALIIYQKFCTVIVLKYEAHALLNFTEWLEKLQIIHEILFKDVFFSY